MLSGEDHSLPKKHHRANRHVYTRHNPSICTNEVDTRQSRDRSEESRRPGVDTAIQLHRPDRSCHSGCTAPGSDLRLSGTSRNQQVLENDRDGRVDRLAFVRKPCDECGAGAFDPSPKRVAWRSWTNCCAVFPADPRFPPSAGQAPSSTLGSVDTASQGSSLFVRTSFATDKQTKLRPGKPRIPAPSCRECRFSRNLSTQAEELLFVSVDHERPEAHERRNGKALTRQVLGLFGWKARGLCSASRTTDSHGHAPHARGGLASRAA